MIPESATGECDAVRRPGARLMKPIFVGSAIYRNSSYGGRHPLAVPRVSTVMDLCWALEWLPTAQYREAPAATVAELHRFHDPAYVAALRQAEARQAADEEARTRFGLGLGDNPVFPAMFSRPAVSVGGVLLAATLTAAGGTAFVPGGGTHHGRPDRAAGFCYFNDPVLGILRWLDLGLPRVAYLDIDAHHGDGVQDAFADDPRVLTISVHEAGRWPRTGAAVDRAGGAARNFPVPPGFHDDELAFLLREAILPLIERHRPAALFLQGGADGLLEDPQSRLALSNNAHVAVVRALVPLAPRLIVTGGGGYNPWSVARCWTRVWGTLAGFTAPDPLPPVAEGVLRALHWRRGPPLEAWCTCLPDPPRGGHVRPDIEALARGALEESR